MQSYSVGFSIWDALALQTSDGEPCDCFCVVECCGLTFQTETLTEKQTMAVFNEKSMWPDIKLYDKEFESASIEFSLYERCWFTRNRLIGRASLQLSYINNRKNHLYARTWLSLRQYEETDVKASLNVSVFCIAAGQSAPSASEQMQVCQEEEDGDEKKQLEDDLRATVLSTEVKPQPGKPHYVYINIHRVEDLAPVGGGLPKPFVTVEFNGSQVKTEAAPEVEQYDFLQSAKIPVKTPIYEDTILIKLWSHNIFRPDDLLAQGLVSFSELRNNALAPQWFNVYGWDEAEVADLAQITASGEQVKPNKFKGRILISGHVEKVEDEESPLEPARIVAARIAEEPSTSQVALLADCYMVVGLRARLCKVQLSFGKYVMETQAVYQGTQYTDIADANKKEVEPAGDFDWGHEDTVGVFNFTESQGRFGPNILCLTPDEPESQPDVMVSVLTGGLMGSYGRVGWCVHKLGDFTQYEQGSPCRPRFLALDQMPGLKVLNSGSSVLVTIEYNTTDNVIRHKRKEIMPMLYIVRAYCFMARSIDEGYELEEPGNYTLCVRCSGMSNTTKAETNVRPLWMEHLDIKVVLFSDSRTEPPTVEPITVALMNQGTLGTSEIGKASCVYTLMRKKDTLGAWEPYHLTPQWIQLFGGQYGNKPVAEVLVGFELLMWKNREEPQLSPREMWPQPESLYDPAEHYCRLKQATLHFSMMGLRDMPKLGGVVSSHPQAPEVTVSLPSWRSPDDEAGGEQEKVTFAYESTVPGGDPRLKENVLQKWFSKKGMYAQGGVLSSDTWTLANFEFLKSKTINIEIPEKMIFQPFIRIQVHDGADGLLSSKTFIGESMQSLHDHLPCCWYPDVDTTKSYEEQKSIIKNSIKLAREEAAVKPAFEQMSKEEFDKFLAQARKEQMEKAQKRSLVVMDKEVPSQIDNFAIPKQLRQIPAELVRPLTFVDPIELNMQREKGFSPREGPPDREGKAVTNTYDGKLECSRDYRKALWFRDMPLLRNKDVIRPLDDDFDWNFGKQYGFIKCTYKLVDGWAEVTEVDEDGDDVVKEAKEEDDEDDEEDEQDSMLFETFDLDPELKKFGFNQEKLIEKFKSSENMPSRIRVRIYLLKAICIFTKGTSFPDPYVELQIGRTHAISMKNMKEAVETSTPAFNIMQERDIELPMDSRFEVTIQHHQELPFSPEVIGNTVIDLEDRWHCQKWRHASDRQMMPVESRNIFQAGTPGANFGSIEMFVEMLESSAASDRKPTMLVVAADTLIEIRLVIRSAEVLCLGEDEFMDVQVGATLTCDKYEGEHPMQQFTDVHQHSDGACKYDWRIVFPQIRTPVLSCILEIKLYQYSLIAGNTTLGSVTLDMKRNVERVSETMDKVELPAVSLVMQPGGGKKEDGEDGEAEEIGTITMEAVIMSDAEAQEMKAGIAREEPNQHPALFCPTEGRGWGAFLAGIGFGIPWPNMCKKLAPLIIAAIVSMIFFFAGVIAMKQMGLM